MMTTTLSFLSLAPYAESNEPSTHIQATAEMRVSFFPAYILYTMNEGSALTIIIDRSSLNYG